MNQNAPAGDDNDLFANAIDIVEQMGRENDRNAVLPPKALDELEDLRLSFGIEAIGRLVEKDNLWVMNDRLREFQPLLHPG